MSMRNSTTTLNKSESACTQTNKGTLLSVVVLMASCKRILGSNRISLPWREKASVTPEPTDWLNTVRHQNTMSEVSLTGSVTIWLLMLKELSFFGQQLDGCCGKMVREDEGETMSDTQVCMKV